MIQAKPQALFTLLYAGDLSAFINQGNVYALFGAMSVCTPNVDYPMLNAIKNLPDGIQSGTRYFEHFPPLAANKAWGEAYRARFGEYPTNWAWQNAAAMMFLEAAAKNAGTADGKALVPVLSGLTIDCPFGVDGRVTMRTVPPAEARRLVERFEWHYTPRHGSWRDMAETELSVPSTQCLNLRIANKQTLIKEVAAWEISRNQKHAKADWQFTAANARVKLKRLYPVI